MAYKYASASLYIYAHPFSLSLLVLFEPNKICKFAGPAGPGRDRPGPAWERKERGKIERSVMLLKGSWLLSDS